MSKKSLNIVHLYHKEMNIYGDNGNIMILQKRLEWRGIDSRVSLVGVGEAIPKDADIILGGGGQDAGQDKIQVDLQTKSSDLNSLADDGVVMLMVCGMYQLFGRSFKTGDGQIIKGIGILPIETAAGSTRFIGNTLYKTSFGEIVGYENHSGATTLDDTSLAFGKVISGAGNNGQDSSEGCRVKNVFGIYSHGPVLSKNPLFADGLIKAALRRKYQSDELVSLDDTAEILAHKFAKQRPR
jgi:lipid II isoglutaminyl synthase (glutamine-hydrolysing)